MKPREPAMCAWCPGTARGPTPADYFYSAPAKRSLSARVMAPVCKYHWLNTVQPAGGPHVVVSVEDGYDEWVCHHVLSS